MPVPGCPIYCTDFLAAVLRDDYEKVVVHNDDAARLRIAQALDGVDLYFHGGPSFGDEYTWVTITELIVHRIIPRVTLHKDE